MWQGLTNRLARTWPLALLSLTLAVISRELWPRVGERQLIVYGLAAVIFYLALSKITDNRHNHIELEQYRIFLEYLSARLGAGETLRSALERAAQSLGEQLGQSRFHRSLQDMGAALKAQMSLEQSLRIFQKNFQHPKGRAFIRVLPFLERFGGRVDIYVRQSHRSLNAELQTQREIQAEQSAKNSEAFILLFLPFVMAMLLGRGDYGRGLTDLPAAALILDGLYLTACLAAAFSLRLIARQNPYRRQVLKLPKLPPLREGRRCRQVAQFLLGRLPWGFGLKLAAATRFVYADAELAWPRFVAKISRDLIYALILTVLLYLYFLEALVWLLPPLVCAWHIAQLFQAQKIKAESYRLEYPDFLNLMAILLRSGLSLDKALLLQAENLAESSKEYSSLEADLRLLRSQIQTAVPASRALNELSNRLPAREITAAIKLIVRYAEEGGSELLEILEIQALSCWQVYKNAMRAKLARQNLALVIPMGLDLLVILSTTILPALSSFRAI